MGWDHRVFRLFRRGRRQSGRSALVMPWIGYGNAQECRIGCRVLRDPRLRRARPTASKWSNLRQMVRRFANAPVAGGMMLFR